MNKYILIFFLLSSASVNADKVSGWFKKTGNTIKSGGENLVAAVEKTVQNPLPIVIDAAKEAIKVAGVNIDGIEKSVESLKRSVDTIKADADTMKASIQAPTSPLVKAAKIGPQLQQFQTQALGLVNNIKMTDLGAALSSPVSFASFIGTLTSPSVTTNLKNLYSSYDAIITEVDAIDIRPIVGSIETALQDGAKMMDIVMDLFRYAGTPGNLVQMAIGSPIMDATQSVSSGLKKVASDLDLIKQGGLLSVRSSQMNFGMGLISNINKLLPLIPQLQNKPADISKKAATIMPLVATINDDVAKLKSMVTNIQDHLQQMINDKIKTIKGTFDIPHAATQELEKIVSSIRAGLVSILSNVATIVDTVAQIVADGVAGIDAIRGAIGFDLLPMQSRAGIQPLASDISKLAQYIGQLRTAIQNR